MSSSGDETDNAMSGRYPRYSQEANDLLDFARATRRLAARYPVEVHVAETLQQVARFGACQWLDLLSLVLDYEEHALKLLAPRKRR